MRTSARFRRELLAAGLLAALCACAVSPPVPPSAAAPLLTESPSTQQEPAPAPALNEPPVLDWMEEQPAPEFLDEDQRALFLYAYSAASFLMGCSTTALEEYPRLDGTVPDLSVPDWAETVEYDGWTYLVSIGRYRRWSDFQAMMDSLFTREYQRELLSTELEDGTSRALFRSTEDGLLAYLDAARGSDFDYGWCDTPDSYELVSRSEDEIVFQLIGHYTRFAEDESFQDMPKPVGEYTVAYTIRMERTAQGWRFAEFHLPY